MSIDTCPICETATASGLLCCQTCGYSLDDDMWASRKERDQMRQEAREKWLQLQMPTDTSATVDMPATIDLGHNDAQQPKHADFQAGNAQDVYIVNKQHIKQDPAILDSKKKIIDRTQKKENLQISHIKNQQSKQKAKTSVERIFFNISILTFTALIISFLFNSSVITAILLTLLAISVFVNAIHIILLTFNLLETKKLSIRSFVIAIFVLITTFIFNVILGVILFLLFIAILVMISNQNQ